MFDRAKVKQTRTEFEGLEIFDGNVSRFLRVSGSLSPEEEGVITAGNEAELPLSVPGVSECVRGG